MLYSDSVRAWLRPVEHWVTWAMAKERLRRDWQPLRIGGVLERVKNEKEWNKNGNDTTWRCAVDLYKLYSHLWFTTGTHQQSNECFQDDSDHNLNRLQHLLAFVRLGFLEVGDLLLYFLLFFHRQRSDIGVNYFLLGGWGLSGGIMAGWCWWFLS